MTGSLFDLFREGGILAASSFHEALGGSAALVFLIVGGAAAYGLPIARTTRPEISLGRTFVLTLFFLWTAEAAFEASLLLVLLGALFPGRGGVSLRTYLASGAGAAAAMLGVLATGVDLLPWLQGSGRAVLAVPAMVVADIAMQGISAGGFPGRFPAVAGRTVLLYVASLPLALVCSLMVTQSGAFGAALASAAIAGFSLLCGSLDRKYRIYRRRVDTVLVQSRLASLLIGSTSSTGFMRTLEGFLGGGRQGDVLVLLPSADEQTWTVWSSAGQRTIPSVTVGGKPPAAAGEASDLTIDGRRGRALSLRDDGGMVLFTRGAASTLLSSYPPGMLENLMLLVRQTWEAVGHAMKSERSFLAAAVLLARLADSKDDYTHGHSLRVSSLSCSLGERLGLAPDAMRTLRVGAILHDLGKLAIPAEILTKKGLLTKQERELVQDHPEEGAKIVSGLTGYEEVARIIRSHHERMDGTGYPDALSGRGIPFLARIVAVADTFDAITSTRTYHTHTGRDTAMETLRAGRGTQFDARVVDALEEVLLEREGRRNA